MEVNNKDIIIIDPIYIVKSTTENNPNTYPYTPDIVDSDKFEEIEEKYMKWEEEHDDWRKCKFGRNMSVLGFTNYEYSPTLLGNWSCTTFNKDTGEKLGYFCAESSSVAVFELDEVIKYNPNIIEWLKNNSHTATIISRFTGNVNVVTRTTLEGKMSFDYVTVIGRGSVNFYTLPTDL